MKSGIYFLHSLTIPIYISIGVVISGLLFLDVSNNSTVVFSFIGTILVAYVSISIYLHKESSKREELLKNKKDVVKGKALSVFLDKASNMRGHDSVVLMEFCTVLIAWAIFHEIKSNLETAFQGITLSSSNANKQEYLIDIFVNLKQIYDGNHSMLSYNQDVRKIRIRKWGEALENL